MSTDIRSLELEFAKNPTLDACIPLVEAYLENKRFMEAMVVCKKGSKTSANDPRGPVLLARVYLEQGKLPKAQQELDKAMQQFPGNAPGLEMQGRVAMQQGDNQAAVGFLQQALQADPSLTGARLLLQQLGVAPPPAAAPPQAAGAPAGQAPGMPPQMAQMPGQPAGMPQMPQVPMGQPGGMPQMPPQPGRVPMGQPAGMLPQMQQAPGMPGMRPQMQQAPGMPGMRPQMQQAPGMPGMPPQMQQPPGMPGQMPPPGWQQPPPGGVPAEDAVPPGAGAAAQKPLEHVSDFFAPDTLGFASDTSGIETAGPGRLTILGFVPKNTGSIKTTIAVALAVIAIAAAVITWQVISGQNARKVAGFYRQLVAALNEDKYYEYKEALDIGKKVFEVDANHDLTLSALAYDEAVLAMDHDEPGALAKARDFSARAHEAVSQENKYLVAADAMIAYMDKKYQQGYAAVKKLQDKGASSSYIELEAFRLLHAFKPESKETQLQLARLVRSATSSPRVFNYLGWYYLKQGDWGHADKYFTTALQNSKDHPQALLGRALTDLGRGIALKELQKDIDKNIKKVFALPKEELSQPVLALAHFTRSQLLSWQGKAQDAQDDFDQAIKLDDNAFFYFGRGASLVSTGDYKDAVGYLKKAVSRQPNNVRALKKLAEAEADLGDLAGTKAALQSLKSLAPKDPDLHLYAGKALSQAHRWADAITSYKKVTKDDGTPAYATAQIAISAAMRHSGSKKAAKFMESFLENAPADIDKPTQAKAWCELGQDYDAMHNKSKAQQCYNDGIDQYRYDPDCHFHLCRSLGRGAEAKHECKTYLTLAPHGRYAQIAQRFAGR